MCYTLKQELFENLRILTFYHNFAKKYKMDQ